MSPRSGSVLFPILSLQHIKSFTFLSLFHPMIFSKNPSALRNYLFLFSFAGQLTSFSSLSLEQQHYIGNKAKGQILKQVFQEKKACQIFQKRTFLTYVCISGGEKCSFFWKISQALFSWNTHFEIHPFALLPTMLDSSTICHSINFQNIIIHFIFEIFAMVFHVLLIYFEL